MGQSEASSVRRFRRSLTTRMRRRILFVCGCSLLAQSLYAMTAAAQTQDGAAAQTFEVASIRPSSPGPQIPRFRVLPGARLEIPHASLREIVRWAYALGYFDPIEGDSRALDQRFDVVARADTARSPERGNVMPHDVKQYQVMTRRLLADRFGLVVRREARRVAGYALVMARSDRKPGSFLPPSTVDCAALRTRVADGDEQALRAVAPPPTGGPGPCNIFGRDNRTRLGGHTMAEFAEFLATLVLRAPVEDRTGLNGPFAIEITHAPVRAMPSSAADLPDLPSLSTALREQLGLALERVEVTIESLVVDRVGPLIQN